MLHHIISTHPNNSCSLPSNVLVSKEIMDYAEKMQRWHDYVEALEEERKKIIVFQRELPLSLELVTQTIEAYRRELSGTTTEHNMPGQSECSEQTSSDHGPVLEEFIPMKPTTINQREGNDNCDKDEEDESLSNKLQMNTTGISTSGKEKDKRKSDWLRSVQLWDHPSSSDPFSPNTTLNKEEVPRKVVVKEVKMNKTGGAFQPFHKENSISTVATKSRNNNNNNNHNNNNNNDGSCVASKVVPSDSVGASSSAEMVGSGRGRGGGENKEEETEGGQRKQRRCWSPELHRRFLHALQQLGGSHVATPKQIRELMRVDGLTNDEVKSHLQKYRLHTRRPGPAVHNNNNPQPPQFVAMGGIWVHPPVHQEPATVAVTNAIYSQVATIRPVLSATPRLTQEAQKHDQKQNQHLEASEGLVSHSDGGHVHSNCPATSSSSHNTTNSPVYAC